MKQEYANSALSGSRHVATFALQMLKDRQKKLELAGRMYQAWEESGHTQQAVADAVGLKLRSYSKALQTGGISYEKLKKMADFLEVDFDWLLKGAPKPPETPDMFASMNGTDPQEIRDLLARMEKKLDETLRRLDDGS